MSKRMKGSVEIRVGEHNVEITGVLSFAETVRKLLREESVNLVSCKSEFIESKGYCCTCTWSDGIVGHESLIDGRKERKCEELDIRRLFTVWVMRDDSEDINRFMFYEDPDRPINGVDPNMITKIPDDLVRALQEIPTDQWQDQTLIII